MNDDFIYIDEEFIIGTEKTILDFYKEKMFFNKITDDESILDFYEHYWDIKISLNNDQEEGLKIVRFRYKSGSPFLSTKEDLAKVLFELINKNQIKITN